MIDELTLLKEMLGDLTNAGIWGICIYVGYKLIIFGGTAASLVYVIKLIVTSVYNHMQSDFTKQDADRIKAETQRWIDSKDAEIRNCRYSADQANREADEVKSMYKILKQKYEVASDDSKSDE